MGFIPERWEKKTEEILSTESRAFGDGWNPPTKKEMVMTWGWCKWQPGFTTLYGFIWIYMDLYGFMWVFFDIPSLVL